jgi:hypothetical protein
MGFGRQPHFEEFHKGKPSIGAGISKREICGLAGDAEIEPDQLFQFLQRVQRQVSISTIAGTSIPRAMLTGV